MNLLPWWYTEYCFKVPTIFDASAKMNIFITDSGIFTKDVYGDWNYLREQLWAIREGLA